MFGLFKKKSERDKLEAQYKKLLAESHSLSHRDRTKSDQKMAEAEEIIRRIEKLDQKSA